ncbi:MAG: hypothetical protein Q9187_003654 [Circinaria calcarea]
MPPFLDHQARQAPEFAAAKQTTSESSMNNTTTKMDGSNEKELGYNGIDQALAMNTSNTPKMSNVEDDAQATIADKNVDVQKLDGKKDHTETDRVIKSGEIDDDTDSQGDEDLHDEYFFTTVVDRSRLSLSERRMKAARRAKQAHMYSKLVEDRIVALETELALLSKQSPPYLDEVAAYSGPKHHLKVVRLAWADFKVKPFSNDLRMWQHVDEYDPATKSVLEVLVEDSRIDDIQEAQSQEISLPSATSVPRSYGSRDTLESSKAAIMHNRHNTGVPIRLRIRSTILLKILDEISNAKVEGGKSKEKLVFLRPFNLLFTYANEIRARLKLLESKHKVTGIPSTEKCTPSLTEGQDLDKVPSIGELGSDRVNLQNRQLAAEGSRECNDYKEAELGSISAVQLPLKETETPEALEHLRLLVEFMDCDLYPMWELRRSLAAGTLRKIAFPDLWHLFEHGQEVRTPDNKQIQIYRVLAFTGGREVLSPRQDIPPDHASQKLSAEGYSAEAFVVECFYVDFDGVQFGPVNKTVMIRRYDGEKDVASLPVFPLMCDPNQEKTRRDLRKRGEEFIRLANTKVVSHKQYSGLTAEQQQEQVDSQIIIDFQLSFITKAENKPKLGVGTLVNHDPREHMEDPANLGRCGTEGCCGNDYIFPDSLIDQNNQNKFLNDMKNLLDPVDDAKYLKKDMEILLPWRVYGFVLRSRKWATFDIDKVQDVTYTDGWDQLVIPSTHKETVLALVRNRARYPEQQENQKNMLSSSDLVRGKGKGLIILLHGEPGVGKTSTAECVADHTKRPLFAITCGDIGENAEKVEEQLEKNFQLAHKWGCVLLLDEAE